MQVAWVGYGSPECRGEDTEEEGVSQIQHTGRGIEVGLGLWFEASFCEKGFVCVDLKGALRVSYFFGVCSFILYLECRAPWSHVWPLGRLWVGSVQLAPDCQRYINRTQGQAILALVTTHQYCQISSPSAASTVSLCGAGSPYRSLEQNMSGEKSRGDQYVQKEPMGLRVGGLWERWSCALPCLELLPLLTEALYRCNI